MSEMIFDLVSSSAKNMCAKLVVPHPKSIEIHSKNLDWVNRFNLVTTTQEIESHEQIKCASLAAHSYPYASPEIISFAADMLSWLFLFDDKFGEGGKDYTMHSMLDRFATYEYSARSGIVPKNATTLHIALVDLAERGEKIGNRRWRSRFVGFIRRYFDGCVLEYPHRRSSIQLSLAEYRGIRSWSVGIHPVFHIIELANGFLSDEESVDPELEEIRERASLLVGWINDVYSMPKESLARDPFNLVILLGNEFSIDVKESFAMAVEIFNEDLLLLEKAIDNLKSKKSLNAQKYIDGLVAWVHGTYTWHAESVRYHANSTI